METNECCSGGGLTGRQRTAAKSRTKTRAALILSARVSVCGEQTCVFSRFHLQQKTVLERSLPERAFSEFPPKTGVSTATGPRCLLGLWYFTGSGSGLNYRHTGVFLLRPGWSAITQLLSGCEKSSLLWFLNYFQSVLIQSVSQAPSWAFPETD